MMDHEQPHWYPATTAEGQAPLDYSSDFSARVKTTKDAAQRKLASFGRASEYEVRKIYGQGIEITYTGREGETSSIPKAATAKVARRNPSRTGSRTNVDRQTSLEFNACPERRKNR